MRFVILVFSFFLSCCDANNNASNESLVGVTWNLVVVERSGIVIEHADEGDFALFFESDGAFRGNELCNGCGGTYEITGEDTLILNAACTEIGCPKYSQYAVSRFPYGATQFQVQAGELRLRLADSDLIYVYR